MKRLSPYNGAFYYDIIYFLEIDMVIEKGTVIHLNGIPFKLSEDTQVLGSDESLKLAKELSHNSFDHMGSCGENP